MKQNNNKSNKFRTNTPEKYSTCSCGAKSKLKSRKNYPYGKKSKPITSQFYQCEKCSKMDFNIKKGGKR